MSGDDSERSWTRRPGKQTAILGRPVRAAVRGSRSTLGSQGSQGCQGSRALRMQPVERIRDDITTPMSTPLVYTPTTSIPMPSIHLHTSSTAEYRGGSSSSLGTRLEDFGSPIPITSPPTSTGVSHSSGSEQRSRSRVRDSRPARDSSPVLLDINGNRDFYDNRIASICTMGSAANEYYGSRSRSQSSDEGRSNSSASQDAQMQEMWAQIDYLWSRVDRDKERARAPLFADDGVHLHSSSMSRREIMDLVDTTNAVTNARLGRIEEMMARMGQWMRDHSCDSPPHDQQ